MPAPVTLAQLRAFAAVAEHKSFSRASETLDVSQPYVSGQIAALEARLGIVLFNRVGRRAYLNEAGALLVPYAERVLATIEEAERSLEEFRGIVSGHLHIAASSTPGAYVLPYLFRQFLDNYPDVELSLQIKDKRIVEQLVQKRQAELGIVASPGTLPDIDVEVLGTDRLLLVVHPNHPWVMRSSISLEELAGQRLIVREKTSGTRMLIEEELVMRGVRPKSRLELSNTDAIKEAVIAGLGVSLISERATRQEILARRLIAVPFTGVALSRNICLLTPNGHKLSLPATVLRHLIVADFADLESKENSPAR